jgi:hypothetical protein
VRPSLKNKRYGSSTSLKWSTELSVWFGKVKERSNIGAHCEKERKEEETFAWQNRTGWKDRAC